MTEHTTSQAELNYDRYIQEYKFEAELNHMGEFALMVDGEIEGWFPSMEDAYNAGMEQHGGLGNFSIQEVGAKPVKLGGMTLMTL